MEGKGCSIGIALGVLLAFNFVPAVFAAQSDGMGEPREQELYFVVDSLNKGMPERGEPLALQTPRAAVENFIVSAREGNFKQAAHSLNLNLIPEEQRARLAPILGEKFYYVLTQKLRINFNDIPDRPDGEIDPVMEADHPSAGKPRRSIKIGSIGLDLWNVEVRIERFKPPNVPPIWLFSPRTVENIERLYEVHGPGPLMGYLPQRIKVGLMSNSAAWYWGTMTMVAILAALCGWIVQAIAVWVLTRLKSDRFAGLAEAASGPVALFSAAIVFHHVTFSLLSLSSPIVTTIRPIVSALIVAVLTWFGIRVIRVIAELNCKAYLERITCEEEWAARSQLTRLSVVKHLVTLIVLCLGLAVVLRELNLFENLSLSLLASAGVASVILGVAAHSVLGNIMAGIQIAVTQPARIGDSISFEGHWGVVEDITYTYITIRTWDARRIIVPLAYFIEHPFENWSMKSAHTIQPIYLHVDYKIDVKTVRAKFQELVSECKDWDGPAEAVLEVTGVKDDAMELRALCSAKDPPFSVEITLPSARRIDRLSQRAGRWAVFTHTPFGMAAGRRAASGRSASTSSARGRYGECRHLLS